jgi:tetratricopeptide (TPR) repeat protein
LIISILFFSNYQQNNKKEYFFAYDYGRNILKPLKEKAILLLKGLDHDCFTIWYLLYVEHRRKDIDIIYIPSLFRNRNFVEAKALFDNILVNNRNKHIYTHSFPALTKNYSLICAGTFYKILEEKISQEYLLKELNTHYYVEFIERGLFNKTIFKDRELELMFKDYSSIKNNYGVNYIDLGEFKKAILAFREALLFNSSNYLAYYNLAIAYSSNKLKKYKLAEWCLERCKEINPNYIEAYISLAKLYYLQHEIEEAIKECKRILKIRPSCQEAILLLSKFIKLKTLL